MAYLVRKSKRLVVRPLTLKDYDVWHRSYESALPRKNEWDPEKKTPDTLTRAHFKKLVNFQAKMRKDDSFYDLAVFEKSSGLMIGRVSAMNVVRGIGHTAFLGYFIDNRFWGKGYGKEAALAMIDIAFRDLKLHRMEAGVEPRNRRSIFTARSLGLRKEGLKKRCVFLRNRWLDLAIYSATCEEFGFKWKGKAQARMR